MRKQTNSADRTLNIIIVSVIIIVLGLGGYAVGTKISENLKNRVDEPEQTYTLQNVAVANGMTVDQYLAEYGVTDQEFTGETSFAEVANKMTLENYAKAQGIDVATLREEYVLPDSVSNDTVMETAQLEMPARIACGGEEQFQNMKTQYGLDESITGDTRWGDVLPIMQEKMIEMYTQQLQADADGDADANGDATGTPAE